MKSTSRPTNFVSTKPKEPRNGTKTREAVLSDWMRSLLLLWQSRMVEIDRSFQQIDDPWKVSAGDLVMIPPASSVGDNA